MEDITAIVSYSLRLDSFGWDVKAFVDDRRGALKAVMEL